MYHRIIILALLFLNPGKSNSSNLLSSLMEISNALPVQFWLVGCDTYNEHEAAGVHHKCYCAPWQCDDEIKVQFKDSPSQTFSLLIYDDNQQLLDTKEIEEVASGVYEYNLILSQDSPDICDQQIQLQIRRDPGEEGIDLPSLTEWANNPGAGDDWTTGANPSVTRFAIGNTDIVFVDYAFIEGETYKLTLYYEATGLAETVVSFRVMDNSFVTQFSNGAAFEGDQTGTIELIFTATINTTKIGVRVALGSNESETVTITNTTATIQVGGYDVIAKTDCLDIRQEHEDSILLTYSNHRNFAGLVYEDFSPANEFQIRIPATFFHQRFPEEDETMELSTSLVTLNGTVRKQRLLDTDYVPYYFHEKLKLILKHQILEIFNRQWVKQEGYEIVEGDRRWPMKKAKCWLSEKDFVHRNIL